MTHLDFLAAVAVGSVTGTIIGHWLYYRYFK